tara:strand:- start:274 stop:504 length:231 start_codon:yes stop_codon:yes gene_type:complete
MKVNCPICSTQVEWSQESPYRPFCCKKCQLIDLGEWASEERKIETAHSPEKDTRHLPDEEEIEAMLAQQSQDFFKH